MNEKDHGRQKSHSKSQNGQEKNFAYKTITYTNTFTKIDSKLFDSRPINNQKFYGAVAGTKIEHLGRK